MPRPARSARVRAARIALFALLALPPLCSAGTASAAPAAMAPPHAYSGHVAEAARRFGIPEAWIWRVMHVESRGKARAVSHAGAMGLMQIMPSTWAMLTARHGLGSDPYDVRANILAGTAYLRAMWDRYGDVRLMLAAYNAGPGRADAYAAGRRGLPAETVAYVGQIAPALGASGVAPLADAPRSEEPGWRTASLFSAQSDRHPDAGMAQGAGQPERNADTSSPATPRPFAPLFVPLSGRDR